MEHFVAQRSVPTVALTLLAALSVMGAAMLMSPATAATDTYCRLPKDAAVDRAISQTGKARPAVAMPVMAMPISAPRKQAHYKHGILPSAPVSYVRCARNPG